MSDAKLESKAIDIKGKNTRNNHKKMWDTRGRTGTIMLNGYHAQQIDGTRQYTHRRVMEAHLGRQLDHSEHVHHIDGNKLNNELANLELISASDHMRHHSTERGLGKDRVGVEPINKLHTDAREIVRGLRLRGWMLQHIQEFTQLSYPTVQKYAKGDQ